MPWFKVTISRVEYLRAEVEIEADDERDAEEVALETVSVDDYECVNAEADTTEVVEIPQPEWSKQESDS